MTYVLVGILHFSESNRNRNCSPIMVRKFQLVLMAAVLLSLHCSKYVEGQLDKDITSSITQRGHGAQYKATNGEPWPKPQLRNMYNDTFMIVRPPIFQFQIVRNTCDMIEDALKRYYGIILKSSSSYSRPITDILTISKPEKAWKSEDKFQGYLDLLQVDLMAPCEYMPHENMDEAYELKINAPGMEGKGLLVASTNWGILRGLETFSQLLFTSEDHLSLRIKTTFILDYPRFSHRSVLLDTSRHFLSMKSLKQNLDLMAFNKFNVFHWHLVDDQAFPYQSKQFPDLSNKGAYHPYTHIYTQQDVAEIIEYARVRGIRVLPEFDTPGHTQSWGPGIPGLLTPCYDKEGRPDGTFGPIDPTKEETYEFVMLFLQEIVSVFPDKYLHLGGDEVSYDCWKSSPVIRDFMEARNWTDYPQVEEYYMQKLVDIVKTFPKNVSYIVWQEVIDNGVRVNKDTIVHVWKLPNNEEEISNVTGLGYRALTSACWYLNKISYGIDWYKYYDCDPHNFNGTEAQKRLVLGGGPTMWTEFVDNTNLISRLWPRAAVPGERLWSNANVRDKSDAARRLEEHRCRMITRGFQVGPANGPGFCNVEYN